MTKAVKKVQTLSGDQVISVSSDVFQRAASGNLVTNVDEIMDFYDQFTGVMIKWTDVLKAAKLVPLHLVNN